jgi:hypothetical protein
MHVPESLPAICYKTAAINLAGNTNHAAGGLPLNPATAQWAHAGHHLIPLICLRVMRMGVGNPRSAPTCIATCSRACATTSMKMSWAAQPDAVQTDRDFGDLMVQTWQHSSSKHVHVRLVLCVARLDDVKVSWELCLLVDSPTHIRQEGAACSYVN